MVKLRKEFEITSNIGKDDNFLTEYKELQEQAGLEMYRIAVVNRTDWERICHIIANNPELQKIIYQQTSNTEVDILMTEGKKIY